MSHCADSDENFVLEVKIRINKEEDTIYIGDNAAGIGVNNYWRAFEPANIPTDNTGLNEYGMGMKTASIFVQQLIIFLCIKTFTAKNISTNW